MYPQYQKSIEACLQCETTCNHCAVSCLEEEDVQSLTKCIRINLECAVICRLTAELMNLESSYTKEICDLCATITSSCAEECEKHSNLEHCKACAEACRACANEAREIYQMLVKQDQGADEPDENISEKIYKEFIHQDECAVTSRAAAELISLKSAYVQQICELNTTICNAFADNLEKYLNKEIEYARKCAITADEAHQHSKTPGHEKEITAKRKHSSALMASSLWRSSLTHIKPHERIINPFWSGYS